MDVVANVKHSQRLLYLANQEIVIQKSSKLSWGVIKKNDIGIKTLSWMSLSQHICFSPKIQVNTNTSTLWYKTQLTKLHFSTEVRVAAVWWRWSVTHSSLFSPLVTRAATKSLLFCLCLTIFSTVIQLCRLCFFLLHCVVFLFSACPLGSKALLL